MSALDATGRPVSRRLDATGPGTADLAGVRLTISTLLRWSPAIVAIAALGWSLGASLPDLGRSDTATVTIGLTDQVVWPFYDAVIARQPALLDEGGVRAAAESATGITASTVEFDLDTGQTNAVLRLVIETDTGDPVDATVLADAIAGGLVEKNLAEQRATVEQRIGELEARLVDGRTRLDELNRQRDVQLFSGQSDDADQTRAAALVVANDIAGLEEQLAASRIEVDLMRPRIGVIAAAVAGGDRSDDVRANAVTAALFGLLAIALVPTLDRRVGRLRSIAQVRRIWPGVPVLDERRGSDLLGQSAGDAVRTIGDEGRVATAVLALDAAASERLTTRADDGSLGDCIVVVPSPEASPALLDAEAIVIVVRRGGLTVRRVERIADDLVALAVAPRAVVLLRR